MLRYAHEYTVQHTYIEQSRAGKLYKQGHTDTKMWQNNQNGQHKFVPHPVTKTTVTVILGD
jgi:hypothetical protein